MIRRFLLTLLFTLCFVLGGCQRDGVPALIEVKSVSPTRLEVGERIEIRGEGFPGGRTADIVFRGTLHRPGEEPVTGVALRFQALVSSESLIELPMTEEIEARFCGGRERLVHTTFRGELEVSFSSRATRSVPVYGILSAVVLDVRPLPRGDTARAELEGRKVLAQHGIAIDEEDHSGVVVKDVLTGSRGESAGLAPGDRIVSFDHVSVASAADIRAPRALSRAAMQVRPRSSIRDEERSLELDTESLRPSPRTERAAVGILGLLVLLLVVFGPKYARVSFWALHLQAAIRVHRVRAATVLRQGKGAYGYVLAGLLLAVLASVPFSRFLVLSELDFALLAMIVLVAHAARAVRWGAVRSLGYVASIAIPLALCLLTVCFLGGSLRLSDYSATQGAGPWEWNAFSHPFSFLLCVLYIQLVTTCAPGTNAPRAFGAGPLLDALSASLLTIAFLGGWRIPYALEGLHSPMLCGVLSGAVFLVKAIGTWIVLAVVREARVRARGPFRARPNVKGVALISLALVSCGVVGWALMRYPVPGDVLWSLRVLTAFAALFVTLVFALHALVRRRLREDPAL